MKKHFFRNKKARYAGISVLLTVAVLVVTVLLNAVVSSLVTRYNLYPSLVGEASFAVSEECFALLDSAFGKARSEGRSDQVKIIFCDKESVVKDYDHKNYYIYNTVRELSEHFDNIRVEYTDIYSNPTEELKSYTTTLHPLTGEVMETPLYPQSVIVAAGDYHCVYSWTDFYAFSSNDDMDSLWAYTGERKMTSALLRAVEGKTRIACLLMNHGETLSDYEIMTALSEAGYTVVTLDLYNDEIPEACEMLISFNPKTDLINDALSERSEVTMLDEFLSKGGRSFYVFLEKFTRQLPNFESYLNSWGVSPDYHTTNGVSYRYSMQDSTNSLTSDGCTIYGGVASGAREDLLSNAGFVVFANPTSLSISSENYMHEADGSYTWKAKSRTLYPLYESSDSSLAWANGMVVDGGSRLMLSMTEQQNASGSSYVGVISSASFATREYLQSAVYGNGDVLLHLFKASGGPENPEGLRIVPFNYREISTITTGQILVWTVVLTAVPAIGVTAAALIVLIRRRRA